MNPPAQDISPSSFRGTIGVSRQDITPPAGIYARCWGAAEHDIGQGVHRPLTLTCITFQSEPAASSPPLVLISADLMSWRSREDEWSVRGAVLEALSLDPARLMFCLSHTHSAPSLRSDDESRPGGELIAPYRARVRDAALRAAQEALASARPGILDWRYGRCDLATNRDLPEPGGQRIVCGFHPEAPADDMLLVGRISDLRGGILATIVNYACHPTTLGWENRLISPDYIGAMRELVESHTGGAPTLFLQGASGELAPAQQYAGDTSLADRHGRRLGYAVLAAMEAMHSPGARLAYQGVVESGAPLAIWREQAAPPSTALAASVRSVELPLKPGPSVQELEEQWRRCDDPVEKERLWRRRAIRKVIGDAPTSPMPLWAWRVGDSFLLGQPNEAYSLLQLRLRECAAPRAMAVINLANGSAGYLPPRDLYRRGAYQVWQTPFAEGSLEVLLAQSEIALNDLARLRGSYIARPVGRAK